MKRRLVAGVFVVACLTWPLLLQAQDAKRYMQKESSVDMTAMKSIFLGWVDMPLEDWAVFGYETKDDWAKTVARLNSVFQRLMQTQSLAERTVVTKDEWVMPDPLVSSEPQRKVQTQRVAARTVVAAKDRDDEGVTESELQIKFSDVRIDAKTYRLYLSIQFIDTKRRVEIASIPIRAYYVGGIGGFERHLGLDLDQLSRKIQIEVTQAPARRR